MYWQCCCDARWQQTLPLDQALYASHREGACLVGLQGAVKVGNTYVGGTCVKSSAGTSGVGVFIWVLCSMTFALAIGSVLLWLQQAGYLTWDLIRSRFSRNNNALDEGLYHELSMDTGF